MRLLTCCLLTVVACKATRNVTDDKFNPIGVPGFQFGGNERYRNMVFLTKQVHNEELKIAYGFIDDHLGRSEEHCPVSRRTAELKTKLEQAMTEILNLWLEPLRHQDYGGDKIVKNFVFSYVPAVRNPQSTAHIDTTWTLNSKRGETFDLEVIFTCGKIQHNSLIGPKTPSFMVSAQNGWHEDNIYAPYVHERYYSKPVMLAHFGRAFGLDDNPSNALSATDLDLNLRDKHHKLVLSDDDKKGIRWLYKYHHDVVDSCLFEDYRLVMSSKPHEEGLPGSHSMKCIPINPWIAMAKQAHLQESYKNFFAAEEIITKINLQVTNPYRTENWLDNEDNLGNSLLHHVAHYWEWSTKQTSDKLPETTELRPTKQWKQLAQELIKDCQIQQLGNCKLLQKSNNKNSAPCHYQTIAELVPKHC